MFRFGEVVMSDFNNKEIEKYEVNCNHCNSKFRVKESDIMGDSYSLPEGEESNYLYVKCPICKKEIVIEVNQILCNGIKEIYKEKI